MTTYPPDEGDPAAARKGGSGVSRAGVERHIPVLIHTAPETFRHRPPRPASYADHPVHHGHFNDHSKDSPDYAFVAEASNAIGAAVSGLREAGRVWIENLTGKLHVGMESLRNRRRGWRIPDGTCYPSQRGEYHWAVGRRSQPRRPRY